MLGGGSILTLHELAAKGKSVREIARLTGIARNTVRKYLRLRELPKPQPRAKRPSKLDPFKAHIRSRIAEGMTNCAVLLEEIQAQGYTGKSSILREFVHPLRAPRRPPSVVRFEVQPGQQAQVDWGVFQYVDTQGKQRHVYGFVMVLSFSRETYLEFTERADLSTFLRCHIHALEHFGGVPKRLLYDNLKTVRLGTDEEGRPLWHPRFVDFALTTGFRPQLCRPYRAQTKGRVERTIQYIKGNFWPGRKFTTLDELNHQARAWCEKVSRRIHGTTHQRPCDLRQREQLQPFPGRTMLSQFLAEERKVARDGFVSFDGSRYGVPAVYAGQHVEVWPRENHVEFRLRGQVLALHPRALLSGTVIPLPEQWAGVSLEGPGRSQPPLAIQVGGPEVEVRSLLVYESVVNGHD